MSIPDEFELFDIIYILMMQIYETFFKAQNKKTIIFKNYPKLLLASFSLSKNLHPQYEFFTGL